MIISYLICFGIWAIFSGIYSSYLIKGWPPHKFGAFLFSGWCVITWIFNYFELMGIHWIKQ